MCLHVQAKSMSCRRKGCPNRQNLPDSAIVWEWIESHYTRIMSLNDLNTIYETLKDEYYVEAARQLPRHLYNPIMQAVAVISAGQSI